MPAASPSSSQRSFTTLATLLLVVAALYFAPKVLIPLALAVLLTFILTPLVIALERQGLRRLYAVILVVFLTFALLGGIGWILLSQFRDLANQLPEHTQNIIAKVEQIHGAGRGLSKFNTMIAEIQASLHKAGQSGPTEENPPLHVVIDSGNLSSFAWVPVLAQPVIEGLASAAVVIILVIFMLVQREDLRNRLIRLVSHGQLTHTTRALDEAAQRISRYLLMQVLVNAGYGTVLAAGLFLIGLFVPPNDIGRYALLWGFVAGSFRFIPYVGTWLGALLLVLFSVAVSPGWTQPILVFALFACLELFVVNVVEPLLFGHSTGVAPVALLVAAIFWTWLWGPIGLVLSTPLTVCLVVLGKYVPQLAFFDVLLGEDWELDPEVSYYQRLLARDQDEAADLVDEYAKDHAVETIFDDLLLPALARTQRDREHGDLSTDDEQFIYQVTRDLLEDLALLRHNQRAAAGKTPSPGPAATDQPTPALILGCPAHSEAEELALAMFQQVIESPGCRMEILSHNVLSAEVLSRVEHEQPALVVVAALPPGGLALARYLCKRLRSQFPELKIAVGRWGQKEKTDRLHERLRQAGADMVGTSLAESRAQIVPLIQVAATSQQVLA